MASKIHELSGRTKTQARVFPSLTKEGNIANWALPVVVLVGVAKDGDATRTPETKQRARAVVGRWSRDHSRSNLYDREYLVVVREGGGILASHVRHILEPATRFRVDDAQRLHGRSGGVRSGHIKPSVARVVPDLVTASYLLDDVDDMAIQSVQDDRETTGRDQKVLERSERDARRADAGSACHRLAVDRI